jgi:glutamine synthetase type III
MKYALYLLLFGWGLCNFVISRHYRERLSVVEQNFEVVTSQLDTFRLKDSTMVAQVKALKIDYGELETINKDLQTKIEKLKYKKSEIKEVVSYQTIIQKDTILMTANEKGCLTYSDEWLNIEVCEDSLANISLITDATVLITERRKHKFLFFRYGKKERRVLVNSSNPYLEFTHLDYVISD